MRPGPSCLLLPLLALPLVHGRAEAQAPLSLEIRGGASIPAGSFTRGPRRGGQLDAAPAFGLHFALRRGRWTGFYAGFSQLRFGCVEDGCRDEGELVSTVWDVGGYLQLQPGSWGPWARLGLIFARVESELPQAGAGGDGASPVSDLGIGGELGLGWRLRLADRLGLSPGVRYALVNSRLDADTVFRMRYWVVDLGVVVGF